ncbi:hypothetical protein SCP_1103660 [Sparassis crispa]|uniref:Uncharacterized protein n=1 Tax=Sparassis crispa TaxID=139825 RepID=A0A401GZY0_9APHY|nr:hypothetical protein SCP_1103660 [Sparassis crispa]GBE87689.1 hypothetical protein SCP_1103660 [Sparassis crispa]
MPFKRACRMTRTTPLHQEQGSHSSSSSCDAWPRPTTTSPPPSCFHCPVRWNACHTLQEGMEEDTDNAPASSAGVSFANGGHALQEGMLDDTNDAPASSAGATFVIIAQHAAPPPPSSLTSLARLPPTTSEQRPCPARGHGE